MPPRLSPNHQTESAYTIDSANASLTVRRTSNPAAISSWMLANIALNATTWSSITWLAQVTELVTQGGLPAAAGSIA